MSKEFYVVTDDTGDHPIHVAYRSRKEAEAVAIPNRFWVCRVTAANEWDAIREAMARFPHLTKREALRVEPDLAP